MRRTSFTLSLTAHGSCSSSHSRLCHLVRSFHFTPGKPSLTIYLVRFLRQIYLSDISIFLASKALSHDKEENRGSCPHRKGTNESSRRTVKRRAETRWRTVDLIKAALWPARRSLVESLRRTLMATIKMRFALSLSLAALSSVYLERNSPRPCRLAPSIPRQRNLFPLLRCSRVSYSCPPHCAMAKGAQEDIPEALCFGGLEQREHLGQAHSLELFHKWKFKATFEAHCTQRKDWTVGPVKWLWYPILLDSRVPSH